jgi:hypothetical protein
MRTQLHSNSHWHFYLSTSGLDFQDKCTESFSSFANSLVFGLLDNASAWNGIFCLYRPMLLAAHILSSSLNHHRILNTTFL